MTSTIICLIEPFEKTECWESFCKEFEAFMSSNDVPDDKKTALLLTRLTPEVFSELKSACQPRSLFGMQYNMSIEKLTQLYKTENDERRLQRFDFRDPKRNPIKDRDEEIEIQLIFGVNDQLIRNEFIKIGNKSFEELIELTKTVELADQSAPSLGNSGPSKTKKTSNLSSDRSEGWRDSVLGAPRRLLVSLGSFSRTASPCTGKEDLPKLPVPDLESTMQKYLAQVEVIAPTYLDKTQALVKSFLAGPGPKLQQRLLDRRDQTINWATDWWLKDMYLSAPVPLPINSNPGFVFEPKKFSNQHEAASFLARFLNGLFDYQEIADRGELQMDRLRSTDGKPGQPMCMAQQYKLFSKYRRPGKELDQQLILDRTSSGNHVIVVNHNQFYSVPVRASDRGRLTEAELTQQILKIMEIPADPRTPPVGVLTAAGRPFWAAARDELVKNEQNRHNLELLERCLCIVCLDDDVLPTTFNDPICKSREIGHWIGDRDETNLFHHALHGGGSRHLGANRWYDKTLQLFLGKDGIWGMNYEHSAAEAPAVLGIIETLENQVASMSPAEESTIPCHLPSPEKLEWRLSEQSMNDIRDAMTSFDAMVEDLDLCVFRFTEYNRDFIKSCKISPDVYIQLILQLSYFRLHGKLVATYESAGLRRFALGRVDCIRSASTEALEWAKAMCQGDPNSQPPPSGMQQEEGAKRVQFTIYSDEKIRQLFDLAVKRQTKEMNDNIAGNGIDNHLMGLRETAKESGDPLPDIFNDEALRIINHFALSTSQITTVNEVIAGYGPVVPDGYGCAYNFRKNGLIFYISAFHSDGRTSTSRFAQALDCSLRATAAMLKGPQNFCRLDPPLRSFRRYRPKDQKRRNCGPGLQYLRGGGTVQEKLRGRRTGRQNLLSKEFGRGKLRSGAPIVSGKHLTPGDVY